VTHVRTSGQKASDVYFIPKDGQLDIARVEGAVVAEVETFTGQLLGTARARVEPGETPTIRVLLDSPPVVFRVVDEHGGPLAGVTVFLNCPDDCAGWFRYAASDAEGLCTFTGISLDEVLANAVKYPDGTMPARLVSLRDRGTAPIEIVFAPDCDLRIRLLERGSPCRGVDVKATSSDRIALTPPASSDESGIADFGRVGGGEWRVMVQHPGYWASEHSIRAARGDGPHPIEIRRLGSVEFLASTPLGNPASQVPIDLRSEEMEQWVGKWIASGKILAPSQGTSTDSGGRLRIDGLPNGPYRWRVTTGEGEREGEITVPAQSVVRVEVSVP